MPTADSAAAKAKKEAAAKAAAANAAALQKAQAALRADDAAAAKAQAKAAADAQAANQRAREALRLDDIAAAQAQAKAKADAAAASQRARDALRADDIASSKSQSTSGSSQGGSGAESKPQVTSDSNNNSSNTGNASTAVKIATSNLFVFSEDSVSVESMTDAIFEDIGGTELIDLTRNDLVYDVQTQTEAYQPIKNLAEIVNKYSPRNLATLQETSEQYFAAFPININNLVPLVPNGNHVASHIYVDWQGTTSLDGIVIETINVDTNNKEFIEVEILNYESLYSDTI